MVGQITCTLELLIATEHALTPIQFGLKNNFPVPVYHPFTWNMADGYLSYLAIWKNEENEFERCTGTTFQT